MHEADLEAQDLERRIQKEEGWCLVPGAGRSSPNPFAEPSKTRQTGAGTRLSRARKESAALTTGNENLRAAEPKARLSHSWLQLQTPCSSRSRKPSPPVSTNFFFVACRNDAGMRPAPLLRPKVASARLQPSQKGGGSLMRRPCNLQLFQMCTELCEDLTNSPVLPISDNAAFLRPSQSIACWTRLRAASQHEQCWLETSGAEIARASAFGMPPNPRQLWIPSTLTPLKGDDNPSSKPRSGTTTK